VEYLPLIAYIVNQAEILSPQALSSFNRVVVSDYIQYRKHITQPSEKKGNKKRYFDIVSVYLTDFSLTLEIACAIVEVFVERRRAIKGIGSGTSITVFRFGYSTK
jgi:hypothetical protein